MRSMMKAMAPVVGIGLLFGIVWQRQAQAEEDLARFEAAIAERESPPEVQGTLADGADLARQILSLRGE